MNHQANREATLRRGRPGDGHSDASAEPGAKESALQDYDWPTYGMTKAMHKYADLDQIAKNNVDRLRLAWTWVSPDKALLEEKAKDEADEWAKGGPSGFKSTPIKVGDTLYISTPMGLVAALDAATGAEKWRFDTTTYEHGRPADMGFNHRGVSYFEAGDKRRIFMGTNNAFLWSLDADTGLPDRTFGQDGKVDLTVGLGQVVDRAKYSNTVAPMIIDDTLVMGAVIEDIPFDRWSPKKQTDMPPGHIRGFDVHTGKQKWIFHSIPRPGEVGNETWENQSWKVTGSTNCIFARADPLVVPDIEALIPLPLDFGEHGVTVFV